MPPVPSPTIPESNACPPTKAAPRFQREHLVELCPAVVDIAGPNLRGRPKWRNIEANTAVTFVVDDMTPDEPGAVKPGCGRGQPNA